MFLKACTASAVVAERKKIYSDTLFLSNHFIHSLFSFAFMYFGSLASHYVGNSASQLSVSISFQLCLLVTSSICILGRWKRIHTYFSASWLLAQDALKLYFPLTIFSFFIREIAFSVVYSSAKQLWSFLSLSSIACARKKREGEKIVCSSLTKLCVWNSKFVGISRILSCSLCLSQILSENAKIMDNCRDVCRIVHVLHVNQCVFHVIHGRIHVITRKENYT